MSGKKVPPNCAQSGTTALRCCRSAPMSQPVKSETQSTPPRTAGDSRRRNPAGARDANLRRRAGDRLGNTVPALAPAPTVLRRVAAPPRRRATLAKARVGADRATVPGPAAAVRGDKVGGVVPALAAAPAVQGRVAAPAGRRAAGAEAVEAGVLQRERVVGDLAEEQDEMGRVRPPAAALAVHGVLPVEVGALEAVRAEFNAAA